MFKVDTSTKEDLVKLIQDNPTLPLFFFCPGELEYNRTMLKDFIVKKQVIYISDEEVFEDYDSVFEHLVDIYSDTVPETMSDKDYGKYIEDKINELEHYEAIVVDIIE